MVIKSSSTPPVSLVIERPTQLYSPLPLSPSFSVLCYEISVTVSSCSGAGLHLILNEKRNGESRLGEMAAGMHAGRYMIITHGIFCYLRWLHLQRTRSTLGLQLLWITLAI
jgi:hypothetical protein